MSRNILIGLVTAIALAAIAFPAWAVLTYVPSLNPAAMQSLATKACKCERAITAGTTHKKCWEEFERLLPINPDRRGGTTCAPISRVSYQVPGTDESVVLHYSIVGTDAPYLCSEAEAIAGEAIYYGVINQGETWEEQVANYRRASAALAQFANDLANGHSIDEVKPLMGCTTGRSSFIG